MILAIQFSGDPLSCRLNQILVNTYRVRPFPASPKLPRQIGRLHTSIRPLSKGTSPLGTPMGFARSVLFTFSARSPPR